MKLLAPILMLIVSLYTSPQGQVANWQTLTPLESSREDVERILGKPQKYFEAFGTYETKSARFSVWYSKGGCSGAVEGLQWNVPSGKMTRLWVQMSKAVSLKFYVPNVKDFAREESPDGYPRYHYTSSDESIVYETIMRKDGSEFVSSITLQPGKGEQHMLCRESNCEQIH